MKQPGNEGEPSRIFWAADGAGGGGPVGDAAATQKAELLQRYGAQLGTLYESMRTDARMVPVLVEYRKALLAGAGEEESLDQHWSTVEDYLTTSPGFQDNLRETLPVLREFVEGKLREPTVDERMEPWAKSQRKELMRRDARSLIALSKQGGDADWKDELLKILQEEIARDAAAQAESGSVLDESRPEDEEPLESSHVKTRPPEDT